MHWHIIDEKNIDFFFLLRPAGTDPQAHTELLVSQIAQLVRKAERQTETREGMEIYTELDIVRGRAEDGHSETELA